MDEYPLWPCIVCNKYEVIEVSEDGTKEYCQDGKNPLEAKQCLEKFRSRGRGMEISGA